MNERRIEEVCRRQDQDSYRNKTHSRGTWDLGMRLVNRKLTTSLAVWPASTCGSICGRLQLLDVLVYLEEGKCG